MARPKDVRLLQWTPNLYALATCPQCGRDGWLCKDQYEGRVSIDCAICDYHETWDLREDEDDE